MAFSPDGSTLYFSDSVARCIYAYHWHRETGKLSDRRVFVRVPREEASSGARIGLAPGSTGFPRRINNGFGGRLRDEEFAACLCSKMIERNAGMNTDDTKTLSGVHPKLIYCASCGWGQDGPYVTRPGQDLLAQAMAGVLYLQGKAGDPPSPVGMGIADLTASFQVEALTTVAEFLKTELSCAQTLNRLDELYRNALAQEMKSA